MTKGYIANPVLNYLRDRRCDRPLPVNPYRRASGLVCVGQYTVRRFQKIRGRLFSRGLAMLIDLEVPRGRLNLAWMSHHHAWRRG